MNFENLRCRTVKILRHNKFNNRSDSFDATTNFGYPGANTTYGNQVLLVFGAKWPKRPALEAHKKISNAN